MVRGGGKGRLDLSSVSVIRDATRHDGHGIGCISAGATPDAPLLAF